MTETLANGYSSESTQRELSNEYQHDRVWMVFKNVCVFVLWMKVASALEGLTTSTSCLNHWTHNKNMLMFQFPRSNHRSGISVADPLLTACYHHSTTGQPCVYHHVWCSTWLSGTAKVMWLVCGSYMVVLVSATHVAQNVPIFL